MVADYVRYRERDFLLLWWLDTSKWDETLRISYLNNLMLVGIVGVMNY